MAKNKGKNKLFKTVRFVLMIVGTSFLGGMLGSSFALGLAKTICESTKTCVIEPSPFFPYGLALFVILTIPFLYYDILQRNFEV